MIRSKLVILALGCLGGWLFAAVPSVVLRAGQTVEIPLTSRFPIASDLIARGAFAPGDVTFIDGPGCPLSADGCTLMITVAPNSKSYAAVPVVVSASGETHSARFELSVIRAGESDSIIDSTPLPKALRLEPSGKRPVRSPMAKTSTSMEKRTTAPLQRSGNELFYAVAQRRPGIRAQGRALGHFTPFTNGPSYQIVELTNRDVAQSLSVSLTGPGTRYFTLDQEASHFRENKNCASLDTIGSGESCLVIIKGEVGDPNKGPQTATLTLQGESGNTASFELRDTTYVYAAGGFNTLGNANVSGGSLLAQCTAGTCSNALQGGTGNNYASTNVSVGQWINAMAITPQGNLIVGGVFGAIGGATSGASSGTAALLAQCTPGPLGAIGAAACINQIGLVSGGVTDPYAFNNGYIDAVTAPFTISGTSYIALGGDFNQIRSTTSSGKMPAKCQFNGTSSNQTCSAYTSTVKVATSAISALNTLGSTSGSPLVHVGGLFTQIAGYPSSAPSSGTTFASCTPGFAGSCSRGMGSDNPNDSILDMTDDGTNLYMGGAFTQIGGYVDSSGGYPLVTCVNGATTTCSNALDGSNDANGFIHGLIYSGGNLYVGGRFTTIGGATAVSGGNMLAVCTVGGTCSNFVTDTNPYASGDDWGGVISAIAIGTQTSIIAN